jgi:hypothetical protein
MEEPNTVYFDYTCPCSYRVLHWLDSTMRAGREPSLTWKNVFFDRSQPSRGGGLIPWSDTREQRQPSSAHAGKSDAQATDAFQTFHESLFDAMLRPWSSRARWLPI